MRRYYNKGVVPILESMQKTITFYHNENIDMLKPGCTLPNLAKVWVQKSINAKIYAFTEGEKDLLQKTREDMVGGPSIVFTRKAVAEKAFILKLTNLRKSFADIDTSQLYPYLMLQLMPTKRYTRWDLDRETGRFILSQSETLSFENMVMYYFQRIRIDCKYENFYTTSRR